MSQPAADLVTSRAALSVRNLVKRYGSTEVVKSISFTVEEGEIFGFLGPNGAGKSTTLSMLAGVLPPSSGSAHLFDRAMFPLTDAIRREIGVVPQDIAIYPTLTATENLELFGSLYGLRGSGLRRRIGEVLEAVGLSQHARTAVGKFSGGMKRRVNIAAGLLHTPRILLLDEPTVGVDPQSRTYIFDLVRQLNRDANMTILYTSHYMEEVELLCNRAAILDNGHIIACDSIRNLVGARGQALVMRLQADAAAIQPALDRVGRLPVVAEAKVLSAASHVSDSIQVKIDVTSVSKALAEVVQIFSQEKLEIQALEVLEPNLETVFLALTGRRLRD